METDNISQGQVKSFSTDADTLSHIENSLIQSFREVFLDKTDFQNKTERF